MSQTSPEIFLHIGIHKTGTTSLQFFLRNNRDLLLKNDILYPLTGIPNAKIPGQHELAWDLNKNNHFNDPGIWNRLQEEIHHFKPEKIVISSEDFYNLSSNLKFLKNYFDGYQVKIIIYLRNYIGYLKSAYFENIKKNHFRGSFMNYAILHINRIDYDNKLLLWSSYFGKDHIIVRLYDDVIQNRGIILDFCDVIGFDVPSSNEQIDLKKNVSPGDKFICALRLLNRLETLLPSFLIDRKRADKLRLSLIKSEPADSFIKMALFLFSGNRVYGKKDMKLLKNILDEMDHSFLLDMIGERGLKILYGNL